MTIERKISKNPVVAYNDMTAVDALRLMRRENIAKVPVLDRKGNLVGVITEKDILKASLTDEKNMSLLEMAYEVSNLTIDKLMTKEVITIGPNTSVEKAARLMITEDLSFLPVLEDQKLIGVLSRSDMFSILMDLFGARNYGTRITFEVDDKIGTLAKISKVLAENNISIISLCTLEEEKGVYTLTLKVQGADSDLLESLISPFARSIITPGE